MIRQSALSAVVAACLLAMGGGVVDMGSTPKGTPAAPSAQPGKTIEEAITACLDPAASVLAAESLIAEKIVRACATAIQSGRLTLAEIAQARLNRGVARTALGDPAIAIAEYAAALHINANRPLALYGQDLAKIRMGRKDEGEADQAAALVLNPAVTREFALYGVD